MPCKTRAGALPPSVVAARPLSAAAKKAPRIIITEPRVSFGACAHVPPDRHMPGYRITAEGPLRGRPDRFRGRQTAFTWGSG
jgi:hypothetical protein